jgi:LacI family transcriptional regulator
VPGRLVVESRYKNLGRSQQPPHVALLIETSLASGRDILRGVAKYIREHGSWALYHEPSSLKELLPSWLRRWQGQGIIARVHNPALARKIAATKIPTIDVLGVPLVHVDNQAIGRMAAEHLIECGFNSFGFIGITDLNWSDQRRDSFHAEIRARGKNFDLCEIPQLESSRTITKRKLEDWVQRLRKPAGVMVCSDQRGQVLLEACRTCGISVPDAIAVLGVDDDEPLCEVSNPSLSSICAAHDLVGYTAAKVLDQFMKTGKAPTTPTLISPRGVITRQSTNVLAINDPELALALRFIRDHGCQSISVDEVARFARVSRSVLQRHFKQRLKRTVHEQILRTRINMATGLLTGSTLDMVSIAERAGFKHAEYMGAVLKRELNQTPAEIRRGARSSKT